MTVKELKMLLDNCNENDEILVRHESEYGMVSYDVKVIEPGDGEYRFTWLTISDD